LFYPKILTIILLFTKNSHELSTFVIKLKKNMRLRTKISLGIGLVTISIITIVTVALLAYTLILRMEIFHKNLATRGNTIFELVMMKQIDNKDLEKLDLETESSFQNERIQVFNESKDLLYSNIKDVVFNIDTHELDVARNGMVTFRKDGLVDGIVLYVKSQNGKNGFVSISAYDQYGWQGLTSASIALICTMLFIALLLILIVYRYLNYVFRPLESFEKHLSQLDTKNIEQRIPIESRSKDEIYNIANTFNVLLDRLQNSFDTQRSFVRHASHELRTPVARMMMQTENALSVDNTNKSVLESLLQDQKEMRDMIAALMQLSKLEFQQKLQKNDIFRADELLFSVRDELAQLYPKSIVQIDYARVPEMEQELELKGDPMLMRIVLLNLITNACHYSPQKSALILINPCDGERLCIQFINDGANISEVDQKNMYQPFFRGSNTKQKSGSGIGLAICKRVVELHEGVIEYSISEKGENVFAIKFRSAHAPIAQ
jgi:two-component system, OmpR family, sensor histidine kinase ArlS